VARAARRGRESFSPAWLERQLARLQPQGAPLCVAFSGGLDSSALLAALVQLKSATRPLRALHVNHHLRAEAAHWSTHCRRVARALGVPLRVLDVTVQRARGASLEAAARAARYEALAGALREGEALLTAHHEDDQAETLLLQLLRGAGVAGLAAMPERAPFAPGVLLRPLLGTSRAALEAWARAEGLTWVEDDSNRELHLDRNYLRAHVLPLLRQRWPASAATIARAARHLGAAQRLLDALAAEDVAGAACGAALAAQVLRRLPPERRRNALRYWISAARRLPPPASRLEEIAGPLLGARADTQPRVVWDDGCVVREGQMLWLRAPPGGGSRRALPAAPARWAWQRQRTRDFGAPFGRLTLRADARGPLDLEALPPVLEVRARGGGEHLQLVPDGPSRSLKGLLQQARVPHEERARLPLLYSGARLLAVADRWVDVAVRAGPHSTRRGRLLWRAAR
jgi:tRNA(Ile)-lysidine synthase